MKPIPMSFKQQKALALLIHTVRDDWGQDGIMTALGQARDAGLPVNFTALVVAALNAAHDARNRYPVVIGMPGPHWEIKREPLATRQPFDRGKTCGICSKDEHHCRTVTRPDDHVFQPIPEIVQRSIPAKARQEPHQ